MGTLSKNHFSRSNHAQTNNRHNERGTSRSGHETSMLDYFKLILDKVRFSNDLFTKEYHKGLKLLTPVEQAELKRWLGMPDKCHDEAACSGLSKRDI
ncbi:MAG: hypothetical protein ABJN36_16085 [Cyclobacteriaceae bacterium]